MTFSRKTSLALTLDVLSFLNKEIWAWASLQQEWWVTPPVTPRDWFRPKHRTKDAGDRLFHRISPDYSHFTFSLKKERFQQSKKKKTQGNLLSSFHSGTGYPGISEGSCKSQGLAAVTLIVLLNWASTSEDSAPLVRIGLSNQSSTRGLTKPLSLSFNGWKRISQRQWTSPTFPSELDSDELESDPK